MMNRKPTDGGTLFGRIRLGYVVIESERLEAWRQFAQDGLGMHVDQHDADTLACRIDERERRLSVLRGRSENVVALGWELQDEEALRLALERLARRGIACQAIQGRQAGQRGVTRFWRLTGPKGLAVELFVEARCSALPLAMKTSAFVTGAGGLGHVAITTRRPVQMQAFWQDIFDARISDHIEDRIDGVDLEFAFLRLNERHHSIATAATRGLRLNPVRTQIHHLNLQAAALDDVIQGYLRCKRLGYAIANAIGQHPNDRELSFYVVTPSGFEMELGWGPLLVDEAHWRQQTYRGISAWGHRPENLSLSHRLGRIRQGLASLLQAEYVPPGGRS